jgi:poly(A) polymerase
MEGGESAEEREGSDTREVRDLSPNDHGSHGND